LGGRRPVAGASGGTIRWVIKTTVYLPDELKLELGRISATSGRSEAELIREAIRSLVATTARPRPRGALFTSEGGAAERDEKLLAGFGER